VSDNVTRLGAVGVAFGPARFVPGGKVEFMGTFLGNIEFNYVLNVLNLYSILQLA
jgi:hypothetical protein